MRLFFILFFSIYSSFSFSGILLTDTGVSVLPEIKQAFYGKVFSSYHAAGLYTSQQCISRSGDYPSQRVTGHKGSTAWNATIYFDSNCSRAYKSVTVHMGSVPYSCPDGSELNDAIGACEENKCKAFSGDKLQVWWPDSFGSDLKGSYMCASNGCVTQIYTSQGCIDGTCTGDSEYNGTECVNPDVSGPCSDNSCTDAAEPPKPPTPEPDPDPEHKPDDPTAPIPDPNPLPPIDVKPPTSEDVDPEPEVTDPTPTPDSNGDIVKAITNMNKDVNKALNNLNVDINKSNADQKNELEKITGNVEQTNDQLNDLRQENIDIYKNTKALILQANADITTGTNRTTNAVKSLKDSLDVGKFGEPSGKVIDLIFSEEALTAIQAEIETKTTELESFAEQAKDLIHISTNFEAGSLSDSSFEVGGVEVKSGLYRFEGVSGQVRPVILFVCALISVWVLFGSRGK